ncbi:helix-turn-helix domain-containing protein [Paenibacillus sp.]|uniref:winged helix-turn-helix transcriptional regulator n=1 Tax=Paenibacillus sp. TaxID=58172 RepID=UPI002D32812A|nr:helix-turn-helix domain-containing protein [Paenibacillus sp.]HZG84778.1 helix-turn-helix domain-containing protein [Paenibacillus sp.]
MSEKTCPVETAVNLVGAKWKIMIIYRLMDGTKRFNELRRLLPGVTQRMLTLHLRELENDGLIARTVYPEVPPRVEYTLTEAGQSLTPILTQLGDWAAAYEKKRAPQSPTTS